MVHALTIFVSAFLLFLVQLIIGKRILPWFGGAPAVWTTCMLFFQLLLLAGYGYAHFLAAKFTHRAQARIHSALLLLSVALMGFAWWHWGSPILPGESWKPESPGQPVWQILKLLSLTVGVPFFILSSTSPLVQRWYSFQSDREQTYRLYALSNAGSMLGLLSYPFLVEPWSRLSTQGQGWGFFYLVFVAGCIVCAKRLPVVAPTSSIAASDGISPKPGWSRVLLWLGLATMTSAMLLSVTNNLCQEVAVVPFLWVLPLAIYLLTFIICFDSPRWYNRRWYLLALMISSLAVLMTALLGLRLGLLTNILSYSVFLFLFCMTCHGELVQLKPAPAFLTLFYLMVACGGAIGGIFVGLIAPAIFKGYWEFHIVLMAGWILLTWVLARDRRSLFYTGDRFHCYLLFGLVSFVTFRFLLFLGYFAKYPTLQNHVTSVSVALAVVVGSLVALVLWKSPRARWIHWPRLTVAVVIFIAECFMLHRTRSGQVGLIAAGRNFYGVTSVQAKVVEAGKTMPIVQLTHGQITHGIQFLEEPMRRVPVGYYSTNSGIGRAFALHPRRSASPAESMNIGVMGLGVGTVAAFGHAGDQVRFYEINPVVIAYSLHDRPLFGYLKETPAEVTVALGDARLSLQRELEAGMTNQFDVLAMDAFSSDSVPVHLLTTEAFEIYLKHLRNRDSILAINISNRFLDFRDLMFSMAAKLGMKAIIVDCRGDEPDRTPSRWCLMSQGTLLGTPGFQKIAAPYEPKSQIVWSDDFSNLFGLLRR